MKGGWVFSTHGAYAADTDVPTILPDHEIMYAGGDRRTADGQRGEGSDCLATYSNSARRWLLNTPATGGPGSWCIGLNRGRTNREYVP